MSKIKFKEKHQKKDKNNDSDTLILRSGKFKARKFEFNNETKHDALNDLDYEDLEIEEESDKISFM